MYYGVSKNRRCASRSVVVWSISGALVFKWRATIMVQAALHARVTIAIIQIIQMQVGWQLQLQWQILVQYCSSIDNKQDLARQPLYNLVIDNNNYKTISKGQLG